MSPKKNDFDLNKAQKKIAICDLIFRRLLDHSIRRDSDFFLGLIDPPKKYTMSIVVYNEPHDPPERKMAQFDLPNDPIACVY